MKKIIFAAFLTLLSLSAFCQKDTLEKYQKEMPNSFTIINVVDSSKFTQDNLEKKEKTLFIVFSPDCGHCQHFMKQMMDSIDLFRKTQIIMVSAMEYVHIKKFYDDFKVATSPFITIGRDANYYFGSYFSTRQFPSIYIYDKKGRFVKKFEGGGIIKEIAAAD